MSPTGVSLRPLRTAQVKDAERPATRAHRPVRERAGRPRTLRWVVLSATLSLALLSFTYAASASAGTYDPIGSGQTTIVLDKRFAFYLAKNKIKLTAKAGAKRKGRKLLLPVNAGNLDPVQGAGEIGDAGTLLFQAGRKKVPLILTRNQVE